MKRVLTVVDNHTIMYTARAHRLLPSSGFYPDRCMHYSPSYKGTTRHCSAQQGSAGQLSEM